MMNPAAVYPYPPGNPIGMPVYPQGMAQPQFAIPGFVAAPIYQPGPAQPQFQSPVQQQQPAVSQNTTVQVNAAPVQQPQQPVVQHTNISIDSGNLQGQQRGPELKNVVVVGPAAGVRPVRTKCALCEATCVTSVTYKNGALTWVLCGVLGIFGIWPFCLIPLCCDDCKDVEHRCPNCQNVVHVHKRI
ncbi:unnamed protein product [Boreogadus saida]